MEIKITRKEFVQPSVEKGEETGYLMVWFSGTASWGFVDSNLRLDVPESTPDADIEQAIRAKYKEATPAQEEAPQAPEEPPIDKPKKGKK